jgi:mediator of RNA polymerase II transcription subunit 18
MYELFLTALVEEEDFEAACSVLSGLCAMPPWTSLHRVLYFKGPSKPTGLANQNSIVKTQRKDMLLLWKELHQQLTRQSYVLQARYEIFKERDLDQPSPDLNTLSGILRWLDFPDPPQARVSITQRKKSEIWEQKNLPSIMTDNKYL